MNILITLCARGGSKGIPGKNIKSLNGLPLIAYSIKVANDFKNIYNVDIVLSTDNDEIKKVAEELGLITSYSRPFFLATDKAGKVETIEDVLIYQENKNSKLYDYVLDLDISSPLRNVNDLCTGLELLIQDTKAFNLFSVNEANRNPYFNIVEKKETGYYNVVKSGNFLSRQEAPKVYDMNSSFYFYRRLFFDLKINKTTTEKSLIYLMPHICFDLDHPIDFEFMEYLISNDKLGFAL